MISVEILNWYELGETCGRDGRDQALAELGSQMKRVLGSGDLLVRHSETELVALLARSDVKDVKVLSRQFRTIVQELNRARSGDSRLEVAIDGMVAPIDTNTIWEILSSSRVALREPQTTSAPKRVH
jgi:GGDEF domain-containing protein